MCSQIQSNVERAALAGSRYLAEGESLWTEKRVFTEIKAEHR